jgi:hypothetical protein
MDPHSFSKPDPDLPKKLHPDPHKVNADPKHLVLGLKSVSECESENETIRDPNSKKMNSYPQH